MGKSDYLSVLREQMFLGGKLLPEHTRGRKSPGGGALRERTGQGENGTSVSGGRRSRRQGPSRVDRHRSRESLRLAILEESKGQEKAAHQHGMGQMSYINHFYFYLWDTGARSLAQRP
jgi:hypothetical protein